MWYIISCGISTVVYYQLLGSKESEEGASSKGFVAL